MTNPALVEVLGAVAYGEQKAHEMATDRARLAGDDVTRRQWRRIADGELGHHEGFVRRLEALGADPQRAMAPYRGAVDRVHDLRAFTAFLRAGRGASLSATLGTGYLRRLHAMGVGPLAAVERLDPTGVVEGLDPRRPTAAAP